jgi:uncharacterized spore protein YtfJ
MSGYGGYSQSGSKNNSMSNSGFNQGVWGDQGNWLNQMYGGAFGNANMQQSLLLQALGGAQGMQNSIFGSAMPNWQQQMQGGAYSGVNANAIQKQLMSSMGQPSNMQTINNQIMGGAGNNYADAMKGTFIQDANRAQQNMLNNLDARTSAIGANGSSRLGIAQGIGSEDINRNLQQGMAKIGYETFDKDLDRKLGIASQADQAGLARQQMAQDMLAGKQNAMMGGLGMSQFMQGLGNNGMGLISMLGQPWANLSNIMGGPTVLSNGYGSGMSAGRSNAMGTGGGGGCYITTAVCHILGMADDCDLLTTLREFRDLYMLTDTNREKLVGEYYATAPTVVEKIRALDDETKLAEAQHVLETYLEPAVAKIKAGDNEGALRLYTDMVHYAEDLVNG